MVDFTLGLQNKLCQLPHSRYCGPKLGYFFVENLNPLTTRRSKSATLLWKIPVILVLYRYRCNFYTVEPFVSAVRSKKQNHFITDTTHFRSLLVPKSCFFGKKAVHCSGALLKIRKRFLSYLLNGYRYHNNFNRFEI